MIKEEGKRRVDMQAADENRLCMNCGLCCDGTLFAVVPLEEAEVALLGKQPLALTVIHDDRCCLEQPCRAYSGLKCGIYKQRPRRCQEWSCYVLEGFRQGLIPMSEARQRIRQAHVLKADLMRALKRWEPEASGISLPVLWKRWNGWATGEGGASFRLERGDALMHMAVLNCYLERYFRSGETET